MIKKEEFEELKKTQLLIEEKKKRKNTWKGSKVLLVDDDEKMLQLLESMLMSSKKDLFLLKTISGKEALLLLKDHEISLIICDQKMPEMNGIELLQKVQTVQPNAIRVLLTAYPNDKVMMEAINVGHVHHFLKKPIEENILSEVIHSSLGRYYLIKENQDLYQLISKQFDTLLRHYEKLSQEITFGAKVQQMLLKGKSSLGKEEFEVDSMTIASKELDGDFFEFVTPHSNVLDVVIGDVMGKGIAAALVGLVVKSQFSQITPSEMMTQVLETPNIWREEVIQISDVLKRVHAHITKSLMDLGYFVTLFYGRFDIEHSSFSYLDCGAPKPIYYSYAKKQCFLIKGKNLPLGILEEQDFTSEELLYQKNDLFVFYSDGITEAKNALGNMFGIKRLEAIIQKFADKLSAKDLGQKIRSSVEKFTGAKEFEDDFTLIIVKILKGQNSSDMVFQQIRLRNDLSQLIELKKFIKKVFSRVVGNKEQFVHQLELAANEIFCNIVKHGYDEQKEREIICEGTIAKGGGYLRILDQGKPIDCIQTTKVDLTGNRFEGYGLYLVQEIADGMKYVPKEKNDGWNCFELFKKFIMKEKKSVKITQKVVDGTVIVTFEEESIDARCAEECKQSILKMIGNKDVKGLILDFSKVQFIDSSGLGCLLSVSKLLKSLGKSFKFSCLTDAVKIMLEMTSMLTIFEIYATVEEALASLKQKPLATDVTHKDFVQKGTVHKVSSQEDIPRKSTEHKASSQENIPRQMHKASSQEQGTSSQKNISQKQTTPKKLSQKNPSKRNTMDKNSPKENFSKENKENKNPPEKKE